MLHKYCNPLVIYVVLFSVLNEVLLNKIMMDYSNFKIKIVKIIDNNDTNIFFIGERWN